MKREDWIEIAKKAGAASFYPAAQEVSKDSFIVGEQFLNRFAKLVEQATLERAAKVCEEISDEYARTESRRYPELKTDAETGASDCENAILKLKGSND